MHGDPRAGRSKGPTTALEIPPATTSQACPPNPSRSPREVLHHRSKRRQSLPETRRPKSPPPTSGTAMQSATTDITNTSNELATNNEIATNGSQPRISPSPFSRHFRQHYTTGNAPDIPTIPHIHRRATSGNTNSREPEGGRARTCSRWFPPIGLLPHQIAVVASSA